MKPEDPELAAEWQYRYEERLGILTAGATPTFEQIAMATKEADETIRLLKLTPNETRT